MPHRCHRRCMSAINSAVDPVHGVAAPADGTDATPGRAPPSRIIRRWYTSRRNHENHLNKGGSLVFLITPRALPMIRGAQPEKRLPKRCSAHASLGNRTYRGRLGGARRRVERQHARKRALLATVSLELLIAVTRCTPALYKSFAARKIFDFFLFSCCQRLARSPR